MFRTLVKTGGSQALHWIGIDRFVKGLKTSPVVIGYHRVVASFTNAAERSIPALLVSRQMLEKHLEWLARHFEIVSLDEIGASSRNETRRARPIAAITFDDGYADVYHQAFPVLQKMKLPAAVFVVSGLVDNPEPLLHDRLYWLLRRACAEWRNLSQDLERLFRGFEKLPVPLQTDDVDVRTPFLATRALLAKLPYDELKQFAAQVERKLPLPRHAFADSRPLTRAMIREMSAHEVTIGSHTQNHVLLTNESAARVRAELERSRRELEEITGAPVRHFAYPDGRFDPAVVNAVAEAGYKFAYTICRHRDPDYPHLTISRRVLWENSCLDSRGAFSPAVMSCQLTGFFDYFTNCSPHESHARVCDPKAQMVPRELEVVR